MSQDTIDRTWGWISWTVGMACLIIGILRGGGPVLVVVGGFAVFLGEERFRLSRPSDGEEERGENP